MSKVLQINNIRKEYKQGAGSVLVLDNISIELSAGKMVALVGPSGSGKSTLLQIAGLLDSPTSGSVSINGEVKSDKSDRIRTHTRRSKIGFVYQFHHLLAEFSASENVMMPQLIAGKNKSDSKQKAKELLDSLGLSGKEQSKPSELSGGEQQRVAIARSIANDPDILLADEPTGNLDNQNSDIVFDLLKRVVRNRKDRMGAIIATHNPELVKKMDRVIEIKDGRII